jgi:hypothetical protein
VAAAVRKPWGGGSLFPAQAGERVGERGDGINPQC